LFKSKIIANPKGIVWDGSKLTARIAEGGLTATYTAVGTGFGGLFAIATEGYAISAEHCRKENYQFLGNIVFYYEVTITTSD
jgi:hypothetical protein